MDVQKSFYSLLRKVKLQLQFEHSARKFQYFLSVCSAFILCLFILARFTVIIDMNLFIMTFISLAAIVFFVQFWRTRPGFKRAAQFFDQYCGEDRASTALAFINEKEMIHQFQRKYALFHMKKAEIDVLKRKKKYIYPIPLCLSLFFIAMTSGMVLFPNDKMEEAKQQKKERALVEETVKELEKLIKKKTNPIAKKSVESAMDDLKGMKNADEALKKLNKQSNELMLKKTQSDENKAALARAINQLKAGNFKELAKALQENNKKLMESELEKLGEQISQFSSEQKKLLAQIIQSKSDGLSSEDIHLLKNRLTTMLDKASQSSQLGDSQKIMQTASESLLEKMLKNNIQSSTTIASNQNNQNLDAPKGEKTSTGSKNGQQNSSSAGNGNEGQGESGNFEGIGNNGNSNSNEGSAPGSGAGLGMGSRNLTIPETVDGKINIEKDSGKMGEGKPVEQGEGNGPVLKGSVRPYEEVYNQYEKASRESTNRMQLPTELESIVKNYFSKINPDRE
ncbi:hypothetical protein [Lederbergia panacisoli]|uniref:hypothetical protein n=1 Tax=Lederbergia panacisoli TaxID=1255251 RepID=UPI00214D1368|nr:hypothetical protein [Lederbergia panacisoli]MCR2820895.1 hypothetical protein [Lederbergia panacisoli]